MEETKNQILVPTVIEKSQFGERAYDIYSKLLEDRIIFLGTEINPQVANIINAQLLYLESVDSKKDIMLYINSPGGDVYSGMSIYDTIQFIKPDVSTICIGMAASMGSMLLAAGAKGKRFALPNSMIMIHQPLVQGMSGQATDIEIHAKELLRIKKNLSQILADRTGKPIKQIDQDVERDYFMTAEEAKDYGLVDGIITHR